MNQLPGGALLHPSAVASLVVLVVNDHVLKRAYPGFVSGKLSDFAGVLLLPLFLHALFELGHWRLLGRRASAHAANRVLVLSVLATVVGFALPELWDPASSAYRHGLGALQWPFRAVAGLLGGSAVPALRPVQATADVTDLLALPMALVALRLARRESPSATRRAAPRRAAVAATMVLAVTAVTSPAAAQKSVNTFNHDGFYLGFEMGGGLLLLDSTASISNGFEQPIPSSARGFALPVGALELGGTLPATGLVLGARLGSGRVSEPVIETLGETFMIRDMELSLTEAQAFVDFYPDPAQGLHFGVALGLISIERVGAGAGQHTGWCASLEAGHGFWLGRQWTLGAVARITAARLRGEEQGKTSLLMPGLFAAIAWH